MSRLTPTDPNTSGMYPAVARQLNRRDILKSSAALALGATAVAAAGARAAALQDLAAEQVIRLASGEPASFDPGVSDGWWELDQFINLFEGLVGVDQRDGTIEMLMAESMEPNADASEFTFTLRDGLTWSDGTPLNAHDFEWSWKRVLMPETAAKYTSALFPIKGAEAYTTGSGTIDDVGVQAVDDHTLKVTLVGATPYFPLLASTWTFAPVPRHVVEQYGVKWVEAGNMVSNGPYVLTAWEHNQRITLEGNSNYWGEPPTITRAEYTLFDDPTAQALVPFENDELDQAELTGNDVERVKSDPELSQLLKSFPRSSCRFIVCDTSNAPTSDVQVRQALSMAIDRATLANAVLKGAFSPAQTILPPDVPGYNPEAALGEDVTKAKDLLAAAGFPNGAGFPQLTLSYPTIDPFPTVAQYLQANWKQQLGIDVKLDPLEFAAFQDWRTSRADQPFNLYLGGWGSDWSDPANWDNQLFASSADFFHTHWKNDQFDQLVDAARTMTDHDQRVAQYMDAEKIIVQEAPVIPLYSDNRFFVIKPYVQGIYHYPVIGATALKYITIAEH